ncbi:hypothetical protein BUALT_Bualt17G0051600 [Buddleja alternifolia]|uniref:CCHC-type domain-containing protein n=1 Tax=Buddleja alternifolia TaxID=168488 RepID=A0AAV6W7U2_9LAMI|nr:hypothetical protein BUALT_Bualt17G0051600 [Buddleja alternifolia]
MAIESSQVVQVKLNGSNYSYWSYLMKVHITGKELKGYIDGSSKAPTESDENYPKLQNEWETNNAKTNFARRYELENTIRNLRQDDKPVREFYNMMNGIWEELDLMDPLELTNSHVYQKVREEQKLVQFLMALRAEFEPLRGSILHRSPLPSVEKILSELVAEETRLKSLSPSTMNTQSVLVAAQKVQFRPSSSFRGYNGKQKVALDECSFCHEKGHWKKDCPSLRNKDRGILPTPRNSQFSQQQLRNSSSLTSSRPVSAFSCELPASPVTNSRSVSHEDIQEMVTQQVQQLLGTSLGKSFNWILDSGASHHMTHDFSVLDDCSTLSSLISIQSADGSSMEVFQMGPISVESSPSKNLSISDVLHVPNLSVNLLSIGQLADSGCIVTFSSSGCLIQDRHTDKQIGIGRKEGNLYILQHLFAPSGKQINSGLSVFASGKSPSMFQLWHSRLGHVSSSRLKFMVSSGLLGDMSYSDLSD